MRLVAIVIALCACSGEPPRTTIVAHRGGTDVVVDRTGPEWDALAKAADDEPGALGQLAELYASRAAWDEFSAVRTRMLEVAPPRPGPAPGGPFPRIGAPGTRPVEPPTVLSRWLNVRTLPELYATQQVTLFELEHQVRQELAFDDGTRRDELTLRLAALRCCKLKFRDAAKLYEDVLRRLPAGDARVPTVRALLADVRAILRSE